MHSSWAAQSTHPGEGVGQTLLTAQLLRPVHCDYQITSQQQRSVALSRAPHQLRPLQHVS